jgi:uncharacterized spore protein YtfJ
MLLRTVCRALTCLTLTASLAGGVGWTAAWGQQSPPAGEPAGAKAGEETPADTGAEGAEGTEGGKPASLSGSQETLQRQYKRFEDGLYRIAEGLRKSDPERADLLLRAIGKSKEERIATQMNELSSLLRSNKQLGEAIERQEDLITNLQVILDLLLSEDRQKELQEEQKRIKAYLEEVNKLIGKEKGNRADNERGVPLDDVEAAQKKIQAQTGELQKKMAREDQAKQAKAGTGQTKPGAQSKPGENQAGEPKEGDPKEGESEAGAGKPSEGKPGDEPKPGEKKPGEKQPGEKQPGEKKPGEKTPGESKPGESKPGEKNPGESKPGESEPGESKPGESKPGESESGESKPGESKPGESGEPSKPQEGSPSESQPGQQSQSGSPQQQQQTPGREELERAKEAMERAIENLKKNKRHDASDDQDDALAELQRAKEKLEEILRQLREEEKERFLAMLEARFQRMLAMQLLVYDGTTKLGRATQSDESRNTARALQLARQEDEIALEATKAVTLLREEGTAVAFPEAVEMLRDDMRTVTRRLEKTEVGELTQSIEKDIIEALEEMIDALQKEMEKSKNKDQQNQQQQNQQQQDPELVDKLAELKMLRTLQLRINNRTRRLGREVDGEQANSAELIDQLEELAERQARIQKATYDISTGRNK